MDAAAEEDMFFTLSQESAQSVRFESNQYEELDTKIFNDPIHGHIELHPLLVKVIDTPQFQRLRNIKQLGANYYVYPGASHHRFEHCIGTCHLAGKLARHLQTKQPYLQISKEDILCVKMAALIHDLGHGPFSHMFDMDFLPRMRQGADVMHEKTSCMMFDYLIDDNNLMKDFEEYNLSETDITFIKEMVFGPLNDDNNNVSMDNGGNLTWKYVGRPKEKSFLYEIVSNQRNKVDVDKWDYFARDCHHLGIKNSFDHNRFIRFCRVLTVQGENPQICARDKECFNVYHMFHVRNTLHRVAYQHKCKTAIEAMICDAMCLADKHIFYTGENGRKYTISMAVDDPVSFTKLTDNVFYEILNSTNNHEDMIKAKSILDRILKRQLYSFVGVAKPVRGDVKGKYAECATMQENIAAFDNAIHKDDIVVKVKNFNYGMKRKNPCDEFRFYSKSNPNKPYRIRREEVSEMLPNTFEDCEILVYCKSPEKLESAKDCFEKWCKAKNYRLPQTKNGVNDALTPLKREETAVGHVAKRRKLEM
uniref:Deoxynucleoside triphosphate triphosphohydrolase SAMHD1 n=1 Tax=Phallusia mammillata TaxID=59560 RepID=A0A6F9DQY0_9ASCI|nr:deoxynucleoside triphosphate triphosphohydrolase SAMHD1 [Phallusia mammillata]